MPEEELRREIERLLERVKRIEGQLGLEAREEDQDTRQAASRPPAPPIAPPPTAEPTAPPVRPVAPPVHTEAPPYAPPPIIGAVEEEAPPRRLEMLIGGTWAAWVGALAIVVAAGFLIKLGIDSGWWGHLSNEMRCLLIAGFGALLLVVGEWVLRKISRAASAGLFGAGLGVLYLDAFATVQYFDLLSREWAFLLMAVVALVGFGITLRGRFRTIGVLSLIGGYLTPILLSGAGGHDLEVLCFLTFLLAVALGLSAVQPKQYRLLRYVALAGQLLLAFIWLVDRGPNHWVMAIVFMSMWWSMLLIETLVAALRGQSPIGNGVAVLVATAGYVTAGCWILDIAAPGGPDWTGIFTAAIAVLAGAAALQFGPGIDAFRQRPTEAIDKLAVVLWLVFGALLTIAVALQFEGFGRAVSWLVIALASIEIGRRLPSRGVDIFGLLVGALATAHVLLVDWWITPNMRTELWSWGGISIDRWSLLVLLGIVGAHIAAQRLRGDEPRPWRVTPTILAAIGTLMWLGLSLLLCEDLWATGAWLVACAALLALHRAGKRQQYLAIALFVLARRP